jgi:glycosyltransferase involved in cell wall biosynthesis
LSPTERKDSYIRQIERYYAAADAFVFPSVNDSFGLVVLESMASGLPVFSSDQAGAAELIDSGRDGFVLPLKEWVEATVHSAPGSRAA